LRKDQRTIGLGFYRVVAGNLEVKARLKKRQIETCRFAFFWGEHKPISLRSWLSI